MRSGRATVVCVGDALIDLLAQPAPDDRNGRGFRAMAGGSVANVAVALARLGVSARFLGRVGDDPFGELLRAELGERGVDVADLLATPGERTTLAIVALDDDAQPRFAFYEGADVRLAPGDLEPARLAGARLLHVGSIALRAASARAAVARAIDLATARGTLISYDPNLRLALWPDEETARAETLGLARRADVLKLNADELRFLTGIAAPEAGLAALARSIWADSPPRRRCLAVVTRGAQGCEYALCERGRALYGGHIAGLRVTAVDTTGAGDAFTGGLLAALLAAGAIVGGQLAIAMPEVVVRACRFANAAAALSTTAAGAIPAMPDADAVARLLDAP